ncbi:MAG: hypothetical protein QNJ30_02135 [Kiloniellales bacterium]|nr:hypothetical protein [Kiloniellales bacterium]
MDEADHQSPQQETFGMAVLVRVLAVGGGCAQMAVGMDMRAAAVVFVSVKMNPLRTHPAQDIETEKHQHHANPELERRGHPFGQAHPQEDHGRADCEERDGMAQPPDRAAQGKAAFASVLAGRHGADRREVVGFKRVLHADQKSERQKSFHTLTPSADSRQLVADQHVDHPRTAE